MNRVTVGQSISIFIDSGAFHLKLIDREFCGSVYAGVINFYFIAPVDEDPGRNRAAASLLKRIRDGVTCNVLGNWVKSPPCDRLVADSLAN